MRISCNSSPFRLTSLSLAGYHDIFLKRLLALFSSGRCTSMALINMPLECIRFFCFYLSAVKIYCSYLRFVAREVEKQACLPTDGQKEIFIWSPCSRFRNVLARTRQASLPPTPGPSHAGGDIISMMLLFAAVVRELGIKNPGEEGEGPSAPQ